MLLKRSFQDVLNSVRNFFDNAGLINSRTEGTPEHAIANLLASEISGLHNSMDFVLSGLKLSTASGLDLDNLANSFGVYRGESAAPADTSKSNIKFFVSSRYSGTAQDLATLIGESDLVIPAGTEVSDGKSKVYYTTADVTFGEDVDPEGNSITEAVFANVYSYSIGTASNADAGELRVHSLATHPVLSTISDYIEVVNILPISNGETTETDAQLRSRVTRMFTAAAGGNKAAIEEAALSVPGVADVYVEDNVFGTGTFGVYIDTTTPIISPGIITAVQAAVDGVKPAGVKAYVRYPDYIGITVKFECLYYNNALRSATNTEITRSIVSYINNLKRGETLTISKLASLVSRHSNVKSSEIIHIKSGSYDVVTQSISNSNTLMHTDQHIGLNEKWFTATALVEVCDPDQQ